MNYFVCYEYDDNIVPTGRSETYQGQTIDEAIYNCLYTKRLKNGAAFLSLITGLVVYDGKYRYVFPSG